MGQIELAVPDAASDITIEADLISKSITISMELAAPQDQVRPTTRIKWLLKMLKEDDPRLIVEAIWPRKTAATQKRPGDLRDSPEALVPDGISDGPTRFRVMLCDSTGGRFSGTRTFIEDVEQMTSDFYRLVGQHLRAWQPAPPKPVKKAEADAISEEDPEDVEI